jgi:hypothetical protein
VDRYQAMTLSTHEFIRRFLMPRPSSQTADFNALARRNAHQ